MKNARKNIVLCCCLLLTQLLVAQSDSLSNWRTKTILPLLNMGMRIDTLSLVPNSIYIIDKQGIIIENKDLFVLQNDSLFFKKATPDSVTLRYRVLPLLLSKTYYHLDSNQIKRADYGSYIGYDYSPTENSSGIFDNKGLNYNGSFARGISFGNNQNLVLNSEFNLQMAGNIGDNIEVVGAITDSNIPLQPDGNTQQLREFDRIYIQLKRKNNSLLAGDYELLRPNSHFMNYFKKLQGATFNNQTNLTKTSQLNSKASVGISRGKFARNTLSVQEGNQGPYRLNGGDGERFIIILGNSEKVWLDGQLLIRGQDNDYVIDYNRGDITFSNKRLINQYSRIIVEFEYADQRYLRSIYTLNTEYLTEKWRVHLNFYNEQDSKNSGGNQQLDSLSRIALRNAGDSIGNIYARSLDTASFSAEKILYRLQDTTYFLANGLWRTDTIIVYSTNADSSLYAVRFTEFGQGRGNYIRLLANSNGPVYQWVMPDIVTGQPMGTHEPVVQLVAPIRKQMMSGGADYQWGKNGLIKTEIALSNNDRNRYSSIGDANNVGLAWLTSATQQWQLGDAKKGVTLRSSLHYELVKNEFEQLNPFRNAEFARDWNSENATKRYDEHSIGASIALQQAERGYLQYDNNVFLQNENYQGFRHGLKGQWKKNGWLINTQTSYLSSESKLEKSDFFRPKMDISKTIKQLDNWKVGIYGEREKNTRRTLASDTLNRNSFYYDLYKVYVESPQKDKYSIGTSYTRRNDFAALASGFKASNQADELQIIGRWAASSKSQLNANMTWRQVSISDTSITNLEAQQTYLGHLDYNLQLWKGAFIANTVYELSSGQEQKISYSYQRVNPGEGQYFWEDTNVDEVIQQNEIRTSSAVSNAPDIIRILLLSNEFVRTNNVVFSQSIRLEPKQLWYNQKGWKKRLSKFSTQSSMNISRRVRAFADVSPWNPFEWNLPDTALTAINTDQRHSLFFNRGDARYDAQLSYTDNWRKTLLLTGFESLRNREWNVRTRWNINARWVLQGQASQGYRIANSDSLVAKFYDIPFWKVEPQLTCLINKDFRVIAFYKYASFRNTLPAAEQAKSTEYSLESSFNRSTTTAIRLKFSYVQVAFQGERNTPTEYAMLQGLQNGENYIWNITLDRTLNKNMQLNIGYEGRKTGLSRLVHTGRAQVRANF